MALNPQEPLSLEMYSMYVIIITLINKDCFSGINFFSNGDSTRSEARAVKFVFFA